jgi:hypothetical protein
MVLSQKNVKAKIMVSSGRTDSRHKKDIHNILFFFCKVVLDPKKKGIQEAPKMRTEQSIC